MTALWTYFALNLVQVAFLRIDAPIALHAPNMGLIILSSGALTALIGIIYALVEKEMKRLLAQSSVENMGIATAGIGAGLTFAAYGHPRLGGASNVDHADFCAVDPDARQLLARGLRHKRITRSTLWDAGLTRLRPEMTYTATTFPAPVRVVFRGLFHPHIEEDEEGQGAFVLTRSHWQVITNISDRLVLKNR